MQPSLDNKTYLYKLAKNKSINMTTWLKSGFLLIKDPMRTKIKSRKSPSHNNVLKQSLITQGLVKKQEKLLQNLNKSIL